MNNTTYKKANERDITHRYFPLQRHIGPNCLYVTWSNLQSLYNVNDTSTAREL